MLPQAHAYTDKVEPFARILRAAIAEEEAAGGGMIAECRFCGALVYYGTSSDALDGHRCPERIEAIRKQLASSPRSGQGGPTGEETWTEYDHERESLDASAPEIEPQKVASVDYRLRRCPLCGARHFRSQWDERDDLICMECGAILGAGRGA